MNNNLKWLMGIIFAAVLYYARNIEPNRVEVTHVPLKLPDLHPDLHGFRIVQITDFHYGSHITIEQLAHCFELVKREKPDLICITGDFTSAREPYDERLLTETLHQLQIGVPVVAVPGNHEYKAGGHIDAVRRMMKECGILDLSNCHITIRQGEGVLHVAGVDDVVYGKSLLHKVLETLPDEGPAILLAHEPDFAVISAPTKRFMLQLSGHTHGGQVRIPFTKRALLHPKYGRMFNAGLYDVDGMKLYVNRGLGTVTLKLRLNCRPEITVFELQ